MGWIPDPSIRRTAAPDLWLIPQLWLGWEIGAAANSILGIQISLLDYLDLCCIIEELPPLIAIIMPQCRDLCSEPSLLPVVSPLWIFSSIIIETDRQYIYSTDNIFFKLYIPEMSGDKHWGQRRPLACMPPRKDMIRIVWLWNQRR